MREKRKAASAGLARSSSDEDPPTPPVKESGGAATTTTAAAVVATAAVAASGAGGGAGTGAHAVAAVTEGKETAAGRDGVTTMTAADSNRSSDAEYEFEYECEYDCGYEHQDVTMVETHEVTCTRNQASVGDVVDTAAAAASGAAASGGGAGQSGAAAETTQSVEAKDDAAAGATAAAVVDTAAVAASGGGAGQRSGDTFDAAADMVATDTVVTVGSGGWRAACNPSRHVTAIVAAVHNALQAAVADSVELPGLYVGLVGMYNSAVAASGRYSAVPAGPGASVTFDKTVMESVSEYVRAFASLLNGATDLTQMSVATTTALSAPSLIHSITMDEASTIEQIEPTMSVVLQVPAGGTVTNVLDSTTEWVTVPRGAKISFQTTADTEDVYEVNVGGDDLEAVYSMTNTVKIMDATEGYVVAVNLDGVGGSGGGNTGILFEFFGIGTGNPPAANLDWDDFRRDYGTDVDAGLAFLEQSGVDAAGSEVAEILAADVHLAAYYIQQLVARQPVVPVRMRAIGIAVFIPHHYMTIECTHGPGKLCSGKPLIITLFDDDRSFSVTFTVQVTDGGRRVRFSTTFFGTDWSIAGAASSFSAGGTGACMGGSDVSEQVLREAIAMVMFVRAVENAERAGTKAKKKAKKNAKKKAKVASCERTKESWVGNRDFFCSQAGDFKTTAVVYEKLQSFDAAPGGSIMRELFNVTGTSCWVSTAMNLLSSPLLSAMSSIPSAPTVDDDGDGGVDDDVAELRAFWSDPAFSTVDPPAGAVVRGLPTNASVVVQRMLQRQDDKRRLFYSSKLATHVLVENAITLAPGEWVDDQIINFYSHLCQLRSDDDQLRSDDDISLPKIWIARSNMYNLIKEVGTGKVRRWTKKVPNLFELDLVLWQLNLNDSHWCSGQVDFNAMEIGLYDSMGTHEHEFYGHMREWLKMEAVARSVDLDLRDWKNVNMDDSTPRQYNFYDCGVFSMMFVSYLALGKEFDFSQADMPVLRERIAFEIATGKLLPVDV